MADKFPKVQGGGSLIVAWQVRNKHVLVVGGGEVAAGRILHALNADARVTVVAPRAGLNAEVAHRVAAGEVAHVDRAFEPADLDGADMVLAAIDDPAASTRVWQLARERRIPANVADVPPECDFFFGSTLRNGPLQVMVSTNGNGPRLAALVRRRIQGSLPKNAGAAIAKVGVLRKKLRKAVPEAEMGGKRMKWMSRVCEEWSFEDLAEMEERDMEQLVGGFAEGKVPSLRQLRGEVEKGVWEWDGSFGWM